MVERPVGCMEDAANAKGLAKLVAVIIMGWNGDERDDETLHAPAAVGPRRFPDWIRGQTVPALN